MKTLKALLRRFDDTQGIPFAELRESLTLDFNFDPKQNRALAGHVAQAIAGQGLDSSPASDLSDFDLEIKTVPLGHGYRPQEDTAVTMISYQQVVKESWWISHCYRKIRVVLFVPVIKHDKSSADAWYIRSPFPWMPSAEDLESLESEWSAIQQIVQKDANLLTSRGPGYGARLSIHPKHSKKDPTSTYQVGTRTITAEKRAFYLQKGFVEEILRANVSLST